MIKATAHRNRGFSHSVQIRNHTLVADEPPERDGEDEGPSPQELLAASLATCTAVTMEMYAKRKGWELGDVAVEVQYTPAERGCPTRFKLALRLPADLGEEQVERLQVIANKCPVHRTLEGEVMFDDHVELIEPAAARR